MHIQLYHSHAVVHECMAKAEILICCLFIRTRTYSKIRLHVRTYAYGSRSVDKHFDKLKGINSNVKDIFSHIHTYVSWLTRMQYNKNDCICFSRI